MEYNYEKNTKDCTVTYFRERTGPNFFRVFYKNVAQIRYTPKEVGAVFGVNAIREWCYEMIKQYGSEDDKQDENYLKYIEKHGFGPEVHHEEPNDNTKMII